MTDDLFANLPPPEPPKQRQPRQPRPQTLADVPLPEPPRRFGIDAKQGEPVLQDRHASRRCDRPARDGGYVCRIGGGAACFSDNGGISWFCRKHRPRGFFASER